MAPESMHVARGIRVEFQQTTGTRHALTEYVEPIRRIMSIALGATAHITALSVGVTPTRHTKPEVMWDVFAAGVGQEVEWTNP